MLTNIVSGRSAASRAESGAQPLPSGTSRVTSQPSFSSWPQAAATEGCSIAVVTICRPPRALAAAAPNIARLLAYVPPEVKVISRGSACRFRAKIARAAASFSAARCPGV